MNVQSLLVSQIWYSFLIYHHDFNACYWSLLFFFIACAFMYVGIVAHLFCDYIGDVVIHVRVDKLSWWHICGRLFSTIAGATLTKISLTSIDYRTWINNYIIECNYSSNLTSVQAPISLMVFSIEFDKNLERCSWKYSQPIATKSCTCHDSDPMVTCANFNCDRRTRFQTRALQMLVRAWMS